MSTYEASEFFPVGSSYYDPNGVIGGNFVGTAAALNIPDLECPKWGLGIGTGTNGDRITTVGPPWLPIVIPPPQALTLDPIWEKSCSGLLSFAPGLQSFAIFDPPRALTPINGPLAPAPKITPATAPAKKTMMLTPPETPVAKPAGMVSDEAAKATSTPDPSLMQDPNSADPKDPSQSTSDDPSQADPNSKNSGSKDPA